MGVRRGRGGAGRRAAPDLPRRLRTGSAPSPRGGRGGVAARRGAEARKRERERGGARRGEGGGLERGKREEGWKARALATREEARVPRSPSLLVLAVGAGRVLTTNTYFVRPPSVSSSLTNAAPG